MYYFRCGDCEICIFFFFLQIPWPNKDNPTFWHKIFSSLPGKELTTPSNFQNLTAFDKKKKKTGWKTPDSSWQNENNNDNKLPKCFFFFLMFLYVTLDHKTSHKGQFFEILIYTASESWINKLSIDVWFVRIGQYLAAIQLLKIWNLNIEKITFKADENKKPNEVLSNAYY